VTGTPTTWFDGAISEVGGLTSGTMYPFFRHHATTRLTVDSPLEINLACTYDSITNQGTIDATVTNTTASAVSGNMHFVVVEDDIPYVWGGGQMTELNQVMRDMLPDATGEAVTVPASDTIMRSRNFTINASWNEMNCKIVVFLQASNREIYQGAEARLIQEPEMAYYGMTVAEVTGNGNGYAEPGEEIEVIAFGKNMGGGNYGDPVAIGCSDPYLSNLSPTVYVFAIGPGDVDTIAGWTFDIAAGCPDPHLAEFTLAFSNGDTSVVPFLVTTRSGFSDDMESGEGSWTHSGTYDNWHLTEHKSNSPSHSWYCGLENIWHYLNQNDISLVSPYFVASPDSAFSFYHQYNLEVDWDYTYVEIDNGSGWWHTLDEYNGAQSTWTQESFSLSDYNGQTVRLRFRLISDYSTYAEGWYIDDILVPMLGIQELNTPQDLKTISLHAYPNPFTNITQIRYSILDAGYSIQKPTLKIYDASGRLVKSFKPESSIQNQESSVVWDGRDDQNRKLGSGVYFITLQNSDSKIVEKAILLK